MNKLNQIIAVVQGQKSRAQKLLTESHRGWNAEAISGITRTYRPKSDGGDGLPAEYKRIHLDVASKARETMEQLASFFDAVVTQETGNRHAIASVVLGEEVFLRDVPVTILLFLEKQLVDLHTFASGLPVLPAEREWRFDENRNCYVTEPTETVRTQKVPKVLVKYVATKEHPAQTEVFSEDVTVGTWTTVHMSSAIPSQRKVEIVRRIEELQDAIKRARVAANSVEVTQEHCGGTILAHVFGDLLKDRVQS